MEPACFQRAVNTLQEQGIKIDVLTTDRLPSIRKIMRDEYPNIHHEFDIWHVVEGKVMNYPKSSIVQSLFIPMY